MNDDPERYDSPVLAKLDQGMGEPVPGDDVACTTCPVALWYWQGNDQLTCFCPALHKDTWDDTRTDLKPIRLCDGREQALAKRALELG